MARWLLPWVAWRPWLFMVSPVLTEAAFALRAETDVLVAIDVQPDFCPGGALAVAGGDAVVAPVNALLGRFRHAVATQDWHPADHASFAASHPGAAPFTSIAMPYGAQTLWPAHCIKGTAGAALHPGLDADRFDLVLRKGFRREIDSYSAFFENDRSTPTGLAGYLRERGLARVVLAGLATDFCVAWSALDAVRLGFAAAVVLPACRGIDLDGSMPLALDRMRSAGVVLLETMPG